jgi:hypothetical protein
MYTATRVSEAKALYFDPYLFFPHSKFVTCPSSPFADVIRCYACCRLVHLWLCCLFNDVVSSSANDWMTVNNELEDLRFLQRWLRLALSKGPNRVGVSLHLRTERDPVSETSCFFFSFFSNYLRIRTMDKVRKPSNSMCYTPSAEPVRIFK